jgi:hypothetical protein
MGVALIREVVEFLMHNKEMTPAERCILYAVAERANDRNGRRVAWNTPQWNLGQVCGLTPVGLRRALQRLAERGYDVRVALGYDSSGEPVYAHRGKQTTYRLPYLVDLPERRYLSTAFEDEKGDTERSKGGTAVRKGGTQRSKGGTQVPPHPETLSTRESGAAARTPAAHAAAADWQDPTKPIIARTLTTGYTPEEIEWAHDVADYLFIEKDNVTAADAVYVAQRWLDEDKRLIAEGKQPDGYLNKREARAAIDAMASWDVAESIQLARDAKRKQIDARRKPGGKP